jgi:hypothetical protein
MVRGLAGYAPQEASPRNSAEVRCWTEENAPVSGSGLHPVMVTACMFSQIGSLPGPGVPPVWAAARVIPGQIRRLFRMLDDREDLTPGKRRQSLRDHQSCGGCDWRCQLAEGSGLVMHTRARCNRTSCGVTITRCKPEPETGAWTSAQHRTHMTSALFPALASRGGDKSQIVAGREHVTRLPLLFRGFKDLLSYPPAALLSPLASLWWLGLRSGKRGDWDDLGGQAAGVQQGWRQPGVAADLLGLDGDRVRPAPAITGHGCFECLMITKNLPPENDVKIFVIIGAVAGVTEVASWAKARAWSGTREHDATALAAALSPRDLNQSQKPAQKP